MDNKERWENQEQQTIIKNAIEDILRNDDKEQIRFLLWAVRGCPWEEYTQKEVATYFRVKFFIENIPRFI